jgi:hypothetical protein
MPSLRATNWLRELSKSPAALASGAGLLRVCLASDPAAREVLEELKDAGVESEGWIMAKVDGAAKGSEEKVYVEPPPKPQEIDLANETKESLAARLVDAGIVTVKSASVEAPAKEA